MLNDNDIKIFLTKLNFEQQAEEDFFASDRSICSAKENYRQVFWKMRSLWMLQEIIGRYHLEFAGKVLELAGGYGCHASFLKKIYRDKIYLCYSDSSITAVRTSGRWEKFFETQIDEKWVAAAEAIPAADSFFDVVFFFAAFHHIQNPLASIAECHRVLKPGGKLYLLLEPACPKLLQPLFEKYKNKRAIREVGFSRREFNKMVRKYFFHVCQYNFTGYYNRERKGALIYYLFLSLLPNWLVDWLPCSQVIVATKD